MAAKEMRERIASKLKDNDFTEELKILENLDLSKTTICGAFKDF